MSATVRVPAAGLDVPVQRSMSPTGWTRVPAASFSEAFPHPPGVGGHVRDGSRRRRPARLSKTPRHSPVPAGAAPGAFHVGHSAAGFRPPVCPAERPGQTPRALAEPQLGRHHLARIVVRPVVELFQRPGHHPPGNVVDRDGHAGQPRVHHRRCGAAVEAGDGEVPADPQPQFRGHAIDHPGESVAARYDGVRAQIRPAGGEQRPDLPAGAGVIHQQFLADGDPVAGQPGPEPGWPLHVPVVRRPVTQRRRCA